MPGYLPAGPAMTTSRSIRASLPRRDVHRRLAGGLDTPTVGTDGHMVDPNRVGEPSRQEFAQQWGGSGSVVDLDGPVHWVEYGADTGSPPVVMVHGLGGSHLNWVRIAPVLAERTRVLTVDLLGFG